MSRAKAWSLDHAELGLGGKKSFRPTIFGTQGMVSSGHYLSTLVGVRVLQEGGRDRRGGRGRPADRQMPTCQ